MSYVFPFLVCNVYDAVLTPTYHGLEAHLRTGVTYSLASYPDNSLTSLFLGSPRTAIGGTGVGLSLTKTKAASICKFGRNNSFISMLNCRRIGRC